MVAFETVTAANASFVKQQPLTAVFVGATNGIGEFTVRELCKTHGRDGPGLKILLVGRNAKAAHTIIDNCKTICPRAEFHFIQAGDISLLRTVDEACDEISRSLGAPNGLQTHPHIDILIQSQGKVEFGPRINTKEGLDKSMSLLYYSRMRFITKLLSLLLSSTLVTGAKIVSVYAAGMESMGKLYPDDLSLDQPNNYGFGNCRTHSIAMKTMFFEDLAARHPEKLSLTHIYPGLVIHDGIEDPNFPLWFKIVWTIVKPFARFFPMYLEPEQIGQRVLYLCTDRHPAKGLTSEQDNAEVATATNGTVGGGSYSVSYTNEVNDVGKYYQKLTTQDFKALVLQHTGQVFEQIEEQGAFEAKKKA